jgi:hypothetical protein
LSGLLRRSTRGWTRWKSGLIGGITCSTSASGYKLLVLSFHHPLWLPIHSKFLRARRCRPYVSYIPMLPYPYWSYSITKMVILCVNSSLHVRRRSFIVF